jgi:hypothetical protein
MCSATPSRSSPVPFLPLKGQGQQLRPAVELLMQWRAGYGGAHHGSPRPTYGRCIPANDTRYNAKMTSPGCGSPRAIEGRGLGCHLASP